MARPTASEKRSQSTLLVRSDCPDWCVSGHGSRSGEESWLHTSEPVHLADGVAARLAMSNDATSGHVDGPYLLIGGNEYSLEQASGLAEELIALVSRARDETRLAVIPVQNDGVAPETGSRTA